MIVAALVSVSVFLVLMKPEFTVLRRRSRPGLAATRDGAMDVPDSLDLLILGASAGLDVAGSLRLVEQYGPRSVTARLGAPLAAVDAGRPLPSALAEIDARAEEPLGVVITTLLGAHADGVPLTEKLEPLATDLRRVATSREQAKARRLSVALLFPLVLFMFPSFALLTVVPVAIETLRLT